MALVLKTFSGYIARHFLVWCGSVFLAMLGVVFLLDYVELIRRGAQKPEATLLVLLQMAVLKLPHMAQELLPFAVLFGTMMAFWHLTRNHELVVARASGVSVWQFLMPAVGLALLVGILAVTVFSPVASAFEATFESLENRILRSGANTFALSRSGLWLRETDAGGNHSVIHADRLGNGELNFENVTFYFYAGADTFVARIDAAEARLDEGVWILGKGTRWERSKPAERFDGERVPTSLTARKIQDSFASPETLSFWELPGFIALLEASGFSSQRHRLHFHALLARPFLLCAMVLIAATFSLRLQRRGGTLMMVGGGVISGFLLYFFSDVVFALGLSAAVPIPLAAWAPAGVSTLLGTAMLLHLEDG